MSSVTLLETRTVLFGRGGPSAVATLDELIESAGIAIIPFDEPAATAAFDAFKRYGKGQRADIGIPDAMPPGFHNQIVWPFAKLLEMVIPRPSPKRIA